MPRTSRLFLIAALLIVTPAVASSSGNLRSALQRDLDQCLAARAKPEHFSAISLSVSLHGKPQTIDLAAGTTAYGGGVPVTPAMLWQIGSNTKAFTAAVILQLEAERRLSVDQTLGRWLPQYSAWRHVTIRRLLNMTSGIPGYDSSNAMLSAYASNPQRNFTLAELVAYAYPTTPGAPPATTGYSYSNTNYILAEMIIERASGRRYSEELDRRFLRAHLGLDSTYYAAFAYPAIVRERMPSGYFFSHDSDNVKLAPLLGRDMRDASVSWLQGAGGIVSTPQDLTRWARALYTGSILQPKQRAEMMSIVSLQNGRPVASTTPQDPRGFGLGIAQLTTPGTGTVWYYEGITFGYRMVHVYFPRQDAVMAIGLNSSPDGKEDSVGKLVTAIYNTFHAAGLL